MDTVHSDVEMAPPDAHEAHDGSASESASSKSSSPPPSPSPAQNSPIVVDDDSPTSSTDLPPPLAAADPATSSSEAAAPAEGVRGRKSKPSSSNVAAAPPGAKPKSTKSAAPRASPSPPPPPARQPLQTIRLDIQLGGPDDYEVNIADLAKSTGQRPATPVPDLGKHDTSDESEGEGEPEPEPEPEPAPAAEGDPQQKGKRRKRVSILPSPRASAHPVENVLPNPCALRAGGAGQPFTARIYADAYKSSTPRVCTAHTHCLHSMYARIYRACSERSVS